MRTTGVEHSNNLPILDSSQNLQVKGDPNIIYEIKFVSPELLNKILANIGPDDEILKIEPGFTIGLATSGKLYLRSDLQSEDYLIKNRNSTDMKEEIVQHLFTITFGRDNSNLSLFKHDREYMIWFDSEYTTEDITTALQFTRLFNNLSATTQFEDESVLKGELKDNYNVIPYYYFNIKIVPNQYLEEYKDKKFKSTTEDVLTDKSGKMIGILSQGYVYLWDGLIGDERNYYITKTLLWNLGFHGETSTYPDSFFYNRANYTAKLSDLDKEAIKLLYGGRLSSNMVVDEMRKALDTSL